MSVLGGFSRRVKPGAGRDPRFVDAPLVVNNSRGQRLCETEIGQRYRRCKVVAFVARQPIEQRHVSAVSLAEIRFGIERLDDPGRRLAS
jgi:hypothetical protein